MTRKGANDPLTLTWNKDGRIELIELANGKSTIEHAKFAGDVKIVHPDLDMTGQTLSLAFDPSRAIKSAAPQPAARRRRRERRSRHDVKPAANDDVADSLREIIATGDVNCRMLEAARAQLSRRRRSGCSSTSRRPAIVSRGSSTPRAGCARSRAATRCRPASSTAELAPAPPAPATTPVATVDASDAKAAVNPLCAGGENAQLVSLVAQGGVKLDDRRTGAKHPRAPPPPTRSRSRTSTAGGSTA